MLREYLLHESFIKTDYDEDGIAELRKVCSVGSYIFSNEERAQLLEKSNQYS